MTSSTSGIEYILQGTQYDELKSASDQITKELLARPEVSKVHSTLENAAPVVKLNIDAVKANAENITPIQIAQHRQQHAGRQRGNDLKRRR